MCTSGLGVIQAPDPLPMSAQVHVLRRHFKESIASLEINTSDASDRIGEQMSGIAVRISYPARDLLHGEVSLPQGQLREWRF